MIGKQIRNKYYYVFWALMSLSVVSVFGMVAHSNYQLANSQNKMAREVRSYLMVKPFPLLCRDGSFLGN